MLWTIEEFWDVKEHFKKEKVTTKSELEVTHDKYLILIGSIK